MIIPVCLYHSHTTIMYCCCQLRSLMLWRLMRFLPLLSFIRSSNAFVVVTAPQSARIYRPMAAPIQPSRQQQEKTRCDYSLKQTSHRLSNVVRPTTRLLQQRSTGDVEDAASKGIVSLLTAIVNSIYDAWSVLFPRIATSQNMDVTASSNSYRNASGVDLKQQSPSSPIELLERIRSDYTERNYLWTGDLDVEANFVKSCRFTDPTLSFVGTDTYIRNIQNLRPILNLVTDVATECRSELIDVRLCDSYIETRWNMIGSLSRLPWRPKVNVIGKTKFWFHNDTNQIYFYDEVWEIPANQALLQLVTPTNYDT